MSDLISSTDYKSFYKDLKGLITERRNKALKVVNVELINLYWEIGKRIFEKQENSKWGDNVIGELSRDLENEFGKGFSKRNMLRIRRFYLTYKDEEKVATLLPQITWSHHGKILDKCNKDDGKDHLRRIFYVKMVIQQKWSVRDLESNLIQSTFERWALKQTNFKETLPGELQSDASVLVKDAYDFSFLDLEEPFKEKKLEDLLVKSIDNTLKNFGTDFCFIGRQFKIEVEGDEYFLDLLFYNRKLKCFVVVELKTTDFKPEHTGKMAFYLSALETQEMQEGENPPIGIVLVKEKNKTKVEYALRDINKPMGVATYTTKEGLPDYLANLLPSEEDINRELNLLG